MDVDLLARLDEERTTNGMKALDPFTFMDRLERLPKLAVLSSDDEFMMMDWSNIWYDDYIKYGESHLLIAPNAEHAMITNLHGVISSVTALFKSIASGHKHSERPHFTYNYDNQTGELSVQIGEGYEVDSVYLRHTETL